MEDGDSMPQSDERGPLPGQATVRPIGQVLPSGAQARGVERSSQKTAKHRSQQTVRQRHPQIMLVRPARHPPLVSGLSGPAAWTPGGTGVVPPEENSEATEFVRAERA